MLNFLSNLSTEAPDQKPSPARVCGLNGVCMLVNRWQAPILPTRQQMALMLESEGLEVQEETVPSTGAADLRHPFDEVRIVVSGQLRLDIAGNRMLLRAGDRILIPANTRHSKQADGEEPCLCLYAMKAD
jgi:mannose-6-phosphate isomerase-like protein (cupin superfamily)